MNRKQFRTLGLVEALSLLVLLFAAMPMKYLGGMPEAVRIVGMLHGILFMLYVLTGFYLVESLGWSYRKLVLAYLIASIPFGPFIFDRFLFPETPAEPGGG